MQEIIVSLAVQTAWWTNELNYIKSNYNMECDLQNLVFFPWIKMFPVEMQHLNYVNYIFLPNMLHCKLRDIMLLLSGDMFFGWFKFSFYILETSPFKIWLD